MSLSHVNTIHHHWHRPPSSQSSVDQIPTAAVLYHPHLFSGFSCTRAISHPSTVQTMAPIEISSLLWSVLTLQGEWVLTVTWHFNTQAYWLCFQTPKDLQTKLLPSSQIWNAVHIPFSHLLLSELQRKIKTHIMVLLGQYILHWEWDISKTRHLQHSSVPCQQVGFLSLLE